MPIVIIRHSMVSSLLGQLHVMILDPHTAKDSVLQIFNNWRRRHLRLRAPPGAENHRRPDHRFHSDAAAEGCSPAISAISATARDLPSAVRAQQLRTLSSVIYSVGVFVIMFLAAMQILPLLGINMGPLLASAGIAGVAIGFGAQTLVRDFINGFFILVENQYDIGDTIRIAGVQGAVEAMTLRRTVLRDDDGSGAQRSQQPDQSGQQSHARLDAGGAAHLGGLRRRQRPGHQAAAEKLARKWRTIRDFADNDCRPSPRFPASRR